MKIHNVEQRSPEWYTLRCGIPTASGFDKIITAKGEPSKQRNKYLYKIVGEYITKVPEETYQNAAMIRGCELESEARRFYQMLTDEEVSEVGFCTNKMQEYGCSPDGLVGDKGLLEIKCPTLATHVGYLIDNIFPAEYFQQIQGQLFVTKREWCDFLSYYPGMKPLVIRIERDEKFIKALEIELNLFCEKLKEIVNQIS